MNTPNTSAERGSDTTGFNAHDCLKGPPSWRALFVLELMPWRKGNAQGECGLRVKISAWAWCSPVVELSGLAGQPLVAFLA